jgi:RHS repeat-associated protein
MIDSANGNKASFYHFDRTGSTLALTDSTGAVTDSYAYTPYGKLLQHNGASEQPFTFVGAWGVRHEGESGNLYHMRARYYDAQTACFLTRDPVWPDIINIEELSPYQYASANPLTYIDPWGEEKVFGNVIITPLGGVLEIGPLMEHWDKLNWFEKMAFVNLLNQEYGLEFSMSMLQEMKRIKADNDRSQLLREKALAFRKKRLSGSNGESVKKPESDLESKRESVNKTVVKGNQVPALNSEIESVPVNPAIEVDHAPPPSRIEDVPYAITLLKFWLRGIGIVPKGAFSNDPELVKERFGI